MTRHVAAEGAERRGLGDAPRKVVKASFTASDAVKEAFTTSERLLWVAL